jgi:hypothetical protein
LAEGRLLELLGTELGREVALDRPAAVPVAAGGGAGAVRPPQLATRRQRRPRAAQGDSRGFGRG